MKPRLRMHIVLPFWLTPSQAAVACAHASLGTYLNFQESPLMREWKDHHFIKIIHQVPETSELFTLCRMFGVNRVFTESSLGDREVAIGFDILSPEHDHIFKQIPLYR